MGILAHGQQASRAAGVGVRTALNTDRSWWRRHRPQVVVADVDAAVTEPPGETDTPLMVAVLIWIWTQEFPDGDAGVRGRLALRHSGCKGVLVLHRWQRRLTDTERGMAQIRAACHLLCSFVRYCRLSLW